jgi:hypothetical protein
MPLQMPGIARVRQRPENNNWRLRWRIFGTSHTLLFFATHSAIASASLKVAEIDLAAARNHIQQFKEISQASALLSRLRWRKLRANYAVPHLRFLMKSQNNMPRNCGLCKSDSMPSCKNRNLHLHPEPPQCEKTKKLPLTPRSQLRRHN